MNTAALHAAAPQLSLFSSQRASWPSTIRKWSGYYGLKNLDRVHFADESQLTAIGDEAFGGSGLREINLPASLTSLGPRAFSGFGPRPTPRSTSFVYLAPYAVQIEFSVQPCLLCMDEDSNKDSPYQ